MRSQEITAIVLAAGYSSRMGILKPLLRLGATTVLERILSLFQDAGVKDVRVVVGYRASDVIPVLREQGVLWALNERFPEGMFSSVKAGVATLEPGSGAFFLLPVDIPLVRRITLQELMEVYHASGKRIVYPTFGGRRGHPPLVAATYVDEILAWHGEGGLRAFLTEKEGEATEVEVADQHVVLDMDTPADYATIVQKWGNYSIPSAAECKVLLAQKFRVSGELVAHSTMVCKLALRLGQALNARGLQMNLELIVAAALLHDIARGRPDHAVTAGRILREMDYPGVAEIVETHMDTWISDDRPVCEGDTVFLADKLVQGDLVLSLEERFQTRLDRYADDPDIVGTIQARLARARKLKSRFEEALGEPLDRFLTDTRREKHNAEAPNSAAELPGNYLTE